MKVNVEHSRCGRYRDKHKIACHMLLITSRVNISSATYMKNRTYAMHNLQLSFELVVIIKFLANDLLFVYMFLKCLILFRH